MNRNLLIKKYNIAGPRYTSYPTVPYWNSDNFSIDVWKNSLNSTDPEGISLYIHLPYCESLCTFCACHKRITKNHSVELPYIEAVIKEWEMYRNILGYKPKISEIHLGGGTPSFFSAENLHYLISNILKNVELSKKHTLSFEGHPNNTTREHLQTLYNLGFRRVSFGVQDFDDKVQKAIHRIQPFENVENVVKAARNIGYESISLDLVYGLPFQTEESISNTAMMSLGLMPERISFYSYAHVPWLKGNGQRGYNESDLPKESTKRALYDKCLSIFNNEGYHEIGMDHFALMHDELFEAQKNKKLNRNFMGYTTTSSKTIIGLGASAISDNWNAFSQNEKNIDSYIEQINSGKFAIIKGHKLDEDDKDIRTHILNLMCNFETDFSKLNLDFLKKELILNNLEEFETDGLILWDMEKLKVTNLGKAFVRNICMAFDQYFTPSSEKIFSSTI